LYQSIVDDLANLSTVDRLGFIHEQTLLAQAGAQSTAAHIPLLTNFARETNEAVWGNIAIAINELKRFVEQDELAENNLKRFVRELTDYNYRRLGWVASTDETDNDIKLRSLIISLSLYGELEDAQKEATSRYQKTPLDKLDNELRTTIMAHAVRTSVNDNVIDKLIEAYKSSSSSEMRDDIASALTATKSEEVIARLSKLLKDSKLIRPQDFTHWYVWMLRNRYGRDYMWQWTQSEWPWLEATFKNDSHYDMLPRYIAGALRTPEQLKQYETFFGAKRDQASLSRNITIGLTELRGRIDLLERDSRVVCEALRDLY
jgi:aminopeptidase N